MIQSIVEIKDIILSKQSLEIDIGKSETLLATILPENATNKDLIWKTSDENIAKVDENGYITGINVGKCVVTVSSNNENITAQCIIKVNPIEVDRLSLDETNVTLGVGQEYILLATRSRNIKSL